MYNEFDKGAGKNSLVGLAGSYHKVILRFLISLSSARRQPSSIYCFTSRNILQSPAHNFPTSGCRVDCRMNIEQ